MDIEFKQIVNFPRGKPAAFEELCCQLARRTEDAGHFVRLHGEGGDGGIEAYVESRDGKRGWQAKYVFDLSGLIKQASRSFRTVLENYPDLRSFVLCFPFDLTGVTGRGEGSIQKLEKWKESQLSDARAKGHDVEIELWPANVLRELLIEHDHNGGMRRFFFGSPILTDHWFEGHLDQARATAGPRYTPEVNVSTDMAKWFAAFGRTSEWSDALSERLLSLDKRISYIHVRDAPTDQGKMKTPKSDTRWGTWPNDTRSRARAQVAAIQEAAGALRSIGHLDKQKYVELMQSLQSSCAELRTVEKELVLDLDGRYGKGKWDFPHWRQLKSEFEASVPTANLDSTRNVISTLSALVDWLESPESMLAFESAFLLTGAAGTGKTHGVCDIAHQRHQQGLRTCLLFGHEFSGEPDPWARIAETLGLADLGREQLLDAMNSAGEASGAPLLVCIDAINETKPLGYWRDRLAPLLNAIRSRPFIRVCVVCRTHYVPACVPAGYELPPFEHQGFKGNEREACRAYFAHYGLQPPAMPILQPELSNPLYLRLVCETAKSQGLLSLPLSWTGSVRTIEAFLHEKEERFAHDHDVPLQAQTMRGTLTALLNHLVAATISELPWSAAIAVALEHVAGLNRDQASKNLDWLVSEGLLIDDAPRGKDLRDESTLRPAFERLGDYLVADGILSDNAVGALDLARWIGTVEDIERHGGILSVLSVLLPERRNGIELPDLVEDTERSEALLKLTMDSLPSRSESAFTDRLDTLVRHALGRVGLSLLTMERLVSVAWRPSPLDANWLDDLLRLAPRLAERDAYWCAFLHYSFSKGGAVAELIDAAFDLALDEVEEAIVERWAKVLIWFTAAADRRVKDRATRAAVAVLAGKPTILPNLVEAMLAVDDDAVRERLLLVAYGALLRTRHLATLESIARTLHHHYSRDASTFANALIRDHIRAICELAEHLDVLPASIDPGFTGKPTGGSTWPLPLPSEGDAEVWSKAIRFWPDEFYSDFFKYSMSCLGRWEMPRHDMAKYMVQTIAQNFGFIGSGCERYDQKMLDEYGGGREKPVWAERIGKKYTWIAMYQLASHLHDNVVPRRESWEPEPIGDPLILAEERQLDPSLPRHRDPPKRHQFFTTPRLDTAGASNDRDWIAFEKDVPLIAEVLKVQSADSQDWRPLVAYLSSGRPDDRHRSDSPYRQIWLELYAYLVRPSDAAIFFEKLSGRNFYGRWIEGAQPSFGNLGGFVAEYPWATTFNTPPDDERSDVAFQYRHEWSSDTADLEPKLLMPTWKSLSCEWEYDVSQDNVSALVPARLFFDRDDLWWDGQAGYQRISDGRRVFLDPSLCLSGPPALLVDEEYLMTRLREMDRCLIWTLLGGKWMLGGTMKQSERPPMRTFSQVACMGADGTIRESDLAFFDSTTDRTGLA